MRRDLSVLIMIGLSFTAMACSNREGMITPQTHNVVIERSAKVPPGIDKYCWEEPIVEFEPIGPGLDVEGKWYYPSYLAVREVRQAKWRPCRPVPDEVKGETKNER